MAVAAEGRVNPSLHSQIKGLVKDGTFRARLLGADRFQLETRALCAERLTWQVTLLCRHFTLCTPFVTAGCNQKFLECK